jgi:hypothetical protein
LKDRWAPEAFPARQRAARQGEVAREPESRRTATDDHDLRSSGTRVNRHRQFPRRTSYANVRVSGHRENAVRAIPVGTRVGRFSGILGCGCAPKRPFRAYNHPVRVKTSITLPADLLERLDRIDSNRSAFPERAAPIYLARLEQSRRDRRDIAIINRHAGRLNRGAKETLE